MLDWVKQVCVLYLHVYVQKVVGTLWVLHKKKLLSVYSTKKMLWILHTKKCSGYFTKKNALWVLHTKKTLSGYFTKKKHWVLHKKNLQPDITDILFKEVHTPII